MYKEEHSPNIYIVDDVKDIHRRWSSYPIKHETIKNGLLSSNQLLRPWDNVPKKALGQEIVGNRVYVGETNGTFTHTIPSTSGDVVRVVGYALGTSKIYFNPDNTWIEIA